MPLSLDLPLILFLGGAVVVLWIFLWSRLQGEEDESGFTVDSALVEETAHVEALVSDMPAVAHGDALLVSQSHGRVIYANEPARRWLDSNGSAPTLEKIARIAEPQDSFLQLFAREGQSSFQLGQRWVEASSHRVPAGPETRTVVVMRELSAGQSNPDTLDVGTAMSLINEIGETVDASMGIEPALQSVLALIRKAIEFDAGEICLWDEEAQSLYQRGWASHDSRYAIALAAAGGKYELDEGITGWIARHQKPVLLGQRDDVSGIKPKLNTGDNPYQSYLGVPLKLGERFIGTLELGSERPDAFNNGHLALLQAISKPVAVCIYNVEIYTRQVQRVEDLAQLGEQADQFKEPEAVFGALNRRVAELVDAEMCGILLYDLERKGLVGQVPFHGSFPDELVRRVFIPLPPGSVQREIWETAEFWLSNDVTHETLTEALDLQSLVEITGIRNTAWLPLQIGERRVGVLAVSNKRGGKTFQGDLRDLSILAMQCATVIENLRLNQRSAQIDVERVGLQELADVIGSISHETEFYDRITERIANIMQIEICGVMLYDDNLRRLMSKLPFYGVDDSLVSEYSIHLRPGSVIEQVWEEDDYYLSNRVPSDPLMFEAGIDEILQQMNVQQMIMAPLYANNRRLGMLQIANKRDGTNFTESDARVLMVFATQTASIIENARLYREVSRTADQAQHLRHIAEQAGSVMSSNDSFTPVLAEIAELTRSEMVFINVLDQQTGSLTTYPRYVFGMELTEPIRQDIYSPGFESSVSVSQKPFISNNVLNADSIIESYRQVAQRFGIRNSIVVPLVYADRVMGELGIANRRADPYGEDDLDTLQVVASQIAAALDRLLIYEATGQNLDRRVEELNAIAEVSNVLARTLKLDEVLESIRTEAVKATGADDSTVVMLKPVEDWMLADVPELERRLGNQEIEGLADIEVEAIMRGSDNVLISDYDFSTMTAAPEAARSAIAAAVLYEDRVVGVIHLYHHQPNYFDYRAANFMMTLAVKGALGYGNYTRFQEQAERSEGYRRRVDQLNRIFEMGHMFQSNTDPISMMQAVAYNVQTSVGFDSVVMLLYDEDANVLRRVAQAGLPVEDFRQSQDDVISIENFNRLLKDHYRMIESYFFPVEEAGQWVVEGIEALSTHFDARRSVHLSGKKIWQDGDMLLVKMTGATGKLIGVMSLDRPHDNRRPDRQMVEVLEIFANQAATTIENMRLYLSSLDSADREAQLNDMIESVSRTLDVEGIVQALADGAIKMFPFNRMTVVVEGEEDDAFAVFTANALFDGGVQVRKERRTSIENTALQRTFNEGREFFYREGHEDTTLFEDLKSWYQSGERSSVVLPLLTGGNCLGAIHFGSNEYVNFMELRAVLWRVAQVIAGAVQNARLFAEAIDLRTLNESVVESIQQGIIVLDNSGRILAANSFMTDRYALLDSEATGQDLFAYLPELADELSENLHKVLETGDPQERINHVMPGVNGDLLVSNFYLYPLLYGDAVRGAVVLMEDVTERAEMEQAMEARANQLAALTDVSNRITASLERDEVVQVALDEMGWLIGHDAMSLWRRHGSYMVLEGASGLVEDVETEESEDNYRFLFSNYPLVRQVVDQQQVLALDNTPDEPVDIPVHLQIGSWMGVPLINQGHVVGLIMLTSTTVGAYVGKPDQNIALAFAGQVAIARANADLFEQTFDRTNELGTLLEAANATSMTSSLEEVFQTVVELMFNALDMDDCAILTWDDVDSELEVQLDMNRYGHEDRITPKGTRYDLAKYPARQHALKNREVVVIQRNDENTPYPEEYQELVENGDHARMLVPLIVSEQSRGLIQLEQTSPQVITQQKVRLARALGNQVAIAIENARLSAQTQAQFEESLIINDLSRAISSTLDLDNMIEIVADQLPRVTASNEMYLALYNEQTEEITFPLAVSYGRRYNIPPRVLGSDEVSFVIEHRRPLTLGSDYFNPDELRRSLNITNGEGEVKSYLGVPLISQDQVYGVLAVRDTERTRAFTVNEQRILETVGSQLGAAIQNARLFEQAGEFQDRLARQIEERTYELEEERDRLDTLYQITSELARTLDIDRLMPRALGMVAKAVSAQDGVIMQLDPITDQLYSRAVLNPHFLQDSPDSDHQVHPAERLARWLIEQDDGVTLVEDLRDEDYWDAESPGASPWRSALAVLLETNDELLGVMVLLSREVNAFVESHLRLMVAAANQVASSINNAELYKLIRDQAERLGSLLRAEQEEAEKNKAILEGIADGVILADQQGDVVLFNNAAERILKIPREQATGKSVSDLLIGVYGPSATKWAQVMENSMERFDDTEFIEERLTLGDRVVNVHLSPVYTQEKFLGTVSAFRDVTREVEAERRKSQFVENVSHEFRTPLTPIKGFVDMVLMGAAGEVTDTQRNILTTVKDNVDRLALLVEDVLQMSQIDMGGERPDYQAVDMNNVVQGVLDNLSGRAKHQGKELDVRFQPVPGLEPIQADQDKIVHVLSNIVDNAFNYTESGGTVEIALEPQPDEKRLLITIADTGVGIPEEFQDRIWERFERHDETALSMDVAGTGLGLPIVRELVEMHRGQVWFTSTVGQGTIFYISLPTEQPDYLANLAGIASENGSK